MRAGVNGDGKELRYVFNYSAEPVTITYRHDDARNLLTGSVVKRGDNLTIQPWDVAIMCKK